MKLYQIDQTYCGTQAETKTLAKAAGVKFDAAIHEQEVPTDKAGLIDFLNNELRIADFHQRRAVTAATAQPLGEIAPMHEPIERYPTDADVDTIKRMAGVAHNINVEEEIGRADYPTAIRLALHATSRLQEHLDGRA